MNFSNDTGFPVKMLSASTGDKEMLVIAGAKVTYQLENGWLIPVSADQAWPVFNKPFVFEGATLGPELEFRKSGIDIFVFGKARAPRGQPVPRMRVTLECGRLRHQTEIFGDRVWTRSKGGLAASDPQSFVEMPLTNDRAYGGKTAFDGLEMVHPINAAGRGFYLSEREAEGKPLPNLEHVENRIKAWHDQPRPACWFKPQGSLALHDADLQDLDKLLVRLMESGFNQTVPELVANPDDLGASLRLVGFAAQGDIVFPMPRRTGPTAHVQIGARRGRFPSSITSLTILAAEQVLIVTYLCLFRYLFEPLESRNMQLQWTDDPKIGPVRA
jgi:Uncharacterized protein conserved in bacteria (DUF2169)